jgi:benzoylformate decarboxylase
VLSLQEATVVGMADGYAQATGRPALVNLHTMAGLGNAIGNLTNAVHNRTPLVVTAGNADRRHLIADPLLSGDLVKLAAGVSRWGHEVRHAGELGVVMRRAFADSATPPAGPVFVGIPQDVLHEEAPPAVTAGGPVPPRSPVWAMGPAAGLTELAALLLASAADDRLGIVAGEEVGTGMAVPALVDVAEALGCRVWGSPLHSVSVFPTAHPLWAGTLPNEAARMRAIFDTAGINRLLLVGSHAFLVYPWSAGAPLSEHMELLQLAPDRASVGRTHPVRLGLVGDIRASLGELVTLVRSASNATERLDAATARYRQRVEREEAAAVAAYGSVPMNPAACVHALLRALPDDITVVDEAVTTATAVRRYHRTTNPGRYFFCRGGGLGWGMPASCGISLARDGEPVLCIVGDGSAMYSPQALWTAASRRLPVVFAVVNNRQYAILKANLRRMGAVSASQGRFVGMDLDDPPVDFLGLAESMGVTATRVEKANDVGPAVEAAWRSGHPALLDLPISPP